MLYIVDGITFYPIIVRIPRKSLCKPSIEFYEFRLPLCVGPRTSSTIMLIIFSSTGDLAALPQAENILAEACPEHLIWYWWILDGMVRTANRWMIDRYLRIFLMTCKTSSSRYQVGSMWSSNLIFMAVVMCNYSFTIVVFFRCWISHVWWNHGTWRWGFK